MAKGRKDTGDLYEVFRKITAQQGDLKPEAVVREQTGQAEEEVHEEPRAEAAVPVPKNRRSFLVSYNTAVITFVAFILVGALLYNTGYKYGWKNGVQHKSKIDTENIIQGPDTIHSLPLSDEKGPSEERWTVEVYSIPKSKKEDLEKNIKRVLVREGYDVFIAHSEDGEKYVLWVNSFPKDSTKAQTTLARMQAKKANDGTHPFKDARFVEFDKSRIVE